MLTNEQLEEIGQGALRGQAITMGPGFALAVVTTIDAKDAEIEQLRADNNELTRQLWAAQQEIERLKTTIHSAVDRARAARCQAHLDNLVCDLITGLQEEGASR